MDMYDKLNVKKIINANATLTRLGGSLMHPTVLDAMAAAARHYVNMNELLEKSGEYIAGILGVEAAFITSGAAAGLTVATAACVAGTDPAAIRRLPDLRGMKSEVLVQKSHRNGYDQAVRQVGVTLVEFGLIKDTHAWDLRAAITAQTAAIVHFAEFENEYNLPLSQVVEIAKEAGVPVIVDAAAEIPPQDNLRRYYQIGADLTVFSGGKDLCGPQSSGLIVGRSNLIRACALNACPNYSIGRPMKVGKEEIAGLVTAIERYLTQDFQAEARMWEDMVAFILKALADIPGLRARRVSPTDLGIQPAWIPKVYLDWDPQVIPLTRDEAARRLLEGQPGIAVGARASGLYVNPHTLEEGQEKVVARRLREVFTGK